MIESANANRHLYNTILASLYLPPMTDEQARYAFQATFLDAMRYLVPQDLHSKIGDAAREAIDYDRDILPLIELMPGYREFIEEARKHELRQAVDTNRTDIGIDKVLMRFNIDKYFDPVISASVVERPKPFPDGVEKIAQTWGCEPGQMLFIGDSPDDRRAAESGGAIFAAFGDNGVGGRIQVSDWQELARILWNTKADSAKGE